MGGVKVLQQLPIRRGLLERVELFAMEVLDQRVPKQGIVGHHADDGRHRCQSGGLGGTPPPLAHHQLISAGHRPHDDRLQ